MAQGQQTTYVGTVPQKRVVSDRIILTDPMDIPLISALGLNGENKIKLVNGPGTKIEWLHDTYSPLSDAAASTNLTNDSTTTSVTVTDGSKFQPGDVVQADNEYIWVSAVNTATNVLTVVRNHGGAQATHASTVTLYIRSRARLEGANASDSHFTQPTSDYNHSFILQKTVEISRSDARIQRYGIPNLVEYEIDKKMDELKIDLTRKPYHGQRKAGSGSTPRDCGGFDAFITTNVITLSSVALTEKHIEDAVQLAWNNGGNPRLLICGAWVKRKIGDFYAGNVRTERAERMGGVTIEKILTRLGIELGVLVDRYCPPASLWILDPDLCGFVTIDEFFYEELGKHGDTDAYGQVIGEYSFFVADEKKHTKITGFSLTS